MKHLTFPFILILLLFVSCQTKTEKITRLVLEMQGKEIIFPQDCSFTISGKDKCASPDINSAFKIVSYIESLGCMSCELKLEEWDRFIQEIDSTSNEKVSFFFYFHPKKRGLKELKSILISTKFKHPVCIDTLDLFNKSNELPQRKSFHAFLLDEHNQVLVIGNPILNPSIKDLYLQAITGEKKEDNRSEPALLSIDESELELGTLKLGNIVKRSIRIDNTGDKPQVIKEVLTSCDCVKATLSDSIVKPKGYTELLLEFNPNETGEYYWDVDILCNEEDSPITIQIHGIIN